MPTHRPGSSIASIPKVEKSFWERRVENIPGSPGSVRVAEGTGYAAPTMATDGVWIFASFANGDLAAFDLEGSPVWSKNLGKPENLYGHASSLVTHGDDLLIQYDQQNIGYVAALDVATGGGALEDETGIRIFLVDAKGLR